MKSARLPLEDYPPTLGARCLSRGDVVFEFGRDESAPDRWAAWHGGEWRAIDGDPRAARGARFSVVRSTPEAVAVFSSAENTWRIRCRWCGRLTAKSWAADDHLGAWRSGLLPACGADVSCPEREA